MKRPKILVINSKRREREKLESHMKDWRYIPLIASNGDEGIDLAKKEQPDLILIDAAMPGKDGFAVCRQLKANKSTINIPVILLTEREVRSFQVQQAIIDMAAEDIGADKHVPKQTDMVVLKRKIWELVKDGPRKEVKQ